MECDPGELTEPALEYAVSLPLPGDERERLRSRCLHRRSCHSIDGGGNTTLLSAKNPVISTLHKGEHEGYTHLHLKRTRVSLVIVAGQTESFPWVIFHHVYEIPGRRGPMYDVIGSAYGWSTKKKTNATYKSTGIDTVYDCPRKFILPKV